MNSTVSVSHTRTRQTNAEIIEATVILSIINTILNNILPSKWIDSDGLQ